MGYELASRSAMHFLVDGICVCCLYLAAERYAAHSLLWAFMTYNVMAFLTQPITGYIADCTRNRYKLLYSSVVLLCTGAAVVSVAVATGDEAGRHDDMLSTAYKGFPLLAALTLGAGNSLFHVWGGKATAIESDNDIRHLGTFVATGAMGLAVGASLASWALLVAFIVALAALALTTGNGEHLKPNVTRKLEKPHWWIAAAMCLIIAVVMLRSLLGQTLAGGELKQLALVAGLTAMLGKMAGGWMCHYMGLIPAAVVMVVAVAVCTAWHGGSTVVILCGLFAVNCTMPVTLYLANVLMPGREGLAFGLLAAALMPGYLIATMNYAL